MITFSTLYSHSIHYCVIHFFLIWILTRDPICWSSHLFFSNLFFIYFILFTLKFFNTRLLWEFFSLLNEKNLNQKRMRLCAHAIKNMINSQCLHLGNNFLWKYFYFHDYYDDVDHIRWVLMLCWHKSITKIIENNTQSHL